jgi:hypothetical protein
MLVLSHPEVAYRSCEDCLLHVYKHDTGKRETDRAGNPVLRGSGKAPCQATIGAPREVRERICAKISPDSDVGLNEKNQRAYEHYLECRATGVFPDDPIVKHNARLIRQMTDIHESGRMELALIKTKG